MAASPTLKEVADSLGVSVSTVSRVANDNPGVHASTRKMIREALERVGYQPNPVATALKTGRGRLVHVVAESEDAAFLMPILAGIAAVAHEQGYRVLLSTIDYEQQRAELDHRFADGFVVVPSFEHSVDLEWLTGMTSAPAVCVYGYAADPRRVSIVSDDTGGARLATERLIARGRRRIAYIGGVPHWLQSQQRLAGYRVTLADNGLPQDERLVDQGDWSRESGYAACGRLLESARPDAVFAANDKMASGVLHCLAERGMRVPDDVAVIGFDDRDLCQFVTPRLTTVALPLREMGARAFEALLANMDAARAGGEPTTGVIPVPCRLVERDSA
jgi:LacI family transcriptional regulator